MSNAAQVLNQIAAALGDGPFKVSRNVKLSDGKKADVAASRTYVSWKGLVILSQHVVVRHVDNATLDDARTLFDVGFKFGKKANWVPLPRGLQFGYMVIPVLVGESPDTSLIQAVSQCPPKHWSLFEYPVLIDLSANQTICFSGTAAWGAFFFSDMRKVADTYIKGSLFNKPDAGDGL
jgi:hypothetical protein